jgi:hypothetical protein
MNKFGHEISNKEAKWKSVRNGCKSLFFGCCNSPFKNNKIDYHFLVDVSLLKGFTT